jgi:hypothetical protein
VTVGYRIASGDDLDALFAARTGAAAAAVGFKDSAGVDLSQRYEQRGATTAIANTGFRNSGGTDLAQIFKDIAAGAGAWGSKTVTMVAGRDAARNYQGYSLNLPPAVDMGSLTSNAFGPYLLATLYWNISSSLNLIYFERNDGVAIPNADSVWSTIQVTGVFADSGGSSVTRTLTRAGVPSSGAGTAPRTLRWWQLGNPPYTNAQFLTGNSYSITINSV